ncbi:MAG: hypothetical protein AMXMBFR58_06050 [Phycisphaerae bacterium]|nr:hypothetical protein [Phycisphaerales bacterium]MCK6476039.1 (2Fe-2S)-binding protein [Phycisphaerales bacterium]
MPVDRCACLGVTFESLREMAVQQSLNAEELCRKTGCGAACGMCVPYIEEMLETGKTTQPARQVPQQVRLQFKRRFS